MLVDPFELTIPFHAQRLTEINSFQITAMLQGDLQMTFLSDVFISIYFSAWTHANSDCFGKEQRQ